jgi:hypothetical protein
MSALELTALLPDFGSLAPSVAQRWVEAMLAQASALREHDAWLYPTDGSRLPAAEHLHAAWHQWCNDAQSLLDQIGDMGKHACAVNGIDELSDTLGRVGAFLQLTPAEAFKRRARALAGDVHSIEEVRRELQLESRR